MIGNEHIAIIPPGHSHKTASLNEKEQNLNIAGFSKDFFDGFIPGMNTEALFKNHNSIIHIKPEDKETIVSMFSKFESLYTCDKDEYTKARTQSLIFDMIFNYTDYNNNSDLADIYDRNGEKSLRTKFVMISRYISKHINEKITLELLAEVFDLSKYEISRKFQKYCGSSFVDYINTVRIGLACSYLTNTDASIESIAESVGYESVSYFSKSFKKYMNMTPKQFAASEKKTKIK